FRTVGAPEQPRRRASERVIIVTEGITAPAAAPRRAMSPADRTDPLVGRTGARFGSSRWRRAAEARADGPVESWAADAEEVRVADTAAGIPQARRPDVAETLVLGAGETAADPAPEPAVDAPEPRPADADATAVADPAAERAADADEA